MHKATTLSHRARRVSKQLEREIKARALNRSFTFAKEDFSGLETWAAKPVQRAVEKEFDLAKAPPKVAHLIVERGATRLSTVMAIMAHHKEETGAVPVLHLRSKRTETIHIPSCLGVFGSAIDSGIEG